MDDAKVGWKFENKNSIGAVYMIPEAVKEYERNIAGDNHLKKAYHKLIDLWLIADSYPLQHKDVFKKIKATEEELYELKKPKTQARLLGYYKDTDFFVLKCIKKKETQLKQKDIETLNKRKKLFEKNKIKWENKNEQVFGRF